MRKLRKKYYCRQSNNILGVNPVICSNTKLRVTFLLVIHKYIFYVIESSILLFCFLPKQLTTKLKINQI